MTDDKAPRNEQGGEKRIFSGEYSKDMWRDINNLNALSTGDDIHNVLYFICCRIQELEAKLTGRR